MRRMVPVCGWWARGGGLLALMMLTLCGCSHGPTPASSPSAIGEQKTFNLREITPEQALGFLSKEAGVSPSFTL